MDPVTVTENELLEAIREAMQADPDKGDALTTREIHAALNAASYTSFHKANQIVRNLCEAGTLLPTKSPRQIRSGTVRMMDAYTLARG